MSPWELLELSPGASEEEIRKAWKRLARKHHPDLNPGDPTAEARFKRLSAAYEQLMSGAVPSSSASGRWRGFDQDELAMLQWIVEVQLRELKETRIPSWVQAWGDGPVLERSLLDRIDELPEVEGKPASWWTRRKLKAPLAKLHAGIERHGPRFRLVLIEHLYSGVRVSISVPALESQGRWEEDELRATVQKALSAGVVAALPVLLEVPAVPEHLDEARRLERGQRFQKHFWTVVWLGVALLSAVFIGTALLGGL